MKKVIRFSLALGEAATFQALFVSKAWAQTASPSSESTTSALPTAGTFGTTLLLVVFGVMLSLIGLLMIFRIKSQEA